MFAAVRAVILKVCSEPLDLNYLGFLAQGQLPGPEADPRSSPAGAQEPFDEARVVMLVLHSMNGEP